MVSTRLNFSTATPEGGFRFDICSESDPMGDGENPKRCSVRPHEVRCTTVVFLMQAIYWIKPVFFSATSAEMWFIEPSPVALVRIEIRKKKFKAFVLSWVNTDVLIPGLNYMFFQMLISAYGKLLMVRLYVEKNQWNAMAIKLLCCYFQTTLKDIYSLKCSIFHS